MALTKIDDRGLKTPIDLLDNEKIRLGTGNDLEIYHNGSQNYINTSNGSLELRHTVSGANEPMIKAFPNGQVQLMYNSATKLDTTNTGISVTGEIVASGGVNFGGGDVTINANSNVMDFIDNFALRLGNSQDLAIYHNGTDSIIDNSTGNLKIVASNDVEAIKVFTDGTVNIGATADNVKLRFGIGSDLQIYHDGTNSIIDNNTGDLVLRGDGDDVKILAEDGIVLRDNDDSTNFVNCINGGAVELYHNGTKKLETTSNGIKVIGESDASAGAIELRHSNGKKNSIGTHFASNAYDSRVEIGISDGSTSGGTNRVASFSYAGLSFGTDTASDNRLDDYEEGTWTPSFDGNAATSTSGNCKYIKIGKVVHCFFRAIHPTTSSSSYATITGLPFTCHGFSVGVPGGAFAETNAGENLSMIVNPNQTFAYILKCDNSGVSVVTQNTISGKDFRGCITFFTT